MPDTTNSVIRSGDCCTCSRCDELVASVSLFNYFAQGESHHDSPITRDSKRCIDCTKQQAARNKKRSTGDCIAHNSWFAFCEARRNRACITQNKPEASCKQIVLVLDYQVPTHCCNEPSHLWYARILAYYRYEYKTSIRSTRSTSYSSTTAG